MGSVISASSFYKQYAKIKANKPAKLLPKKSLPTTPSLHQNMANEVGTMLHQHNYNATKDALYKVNLVSSTVDPPDILREFTFFSDHILV